MSYPGHRHPVEFVAPQMGAIGSKILSSVVDGACVADEAKTPLSEEIGQSGRFEPEGPGLIRSSQRRPQSAGSDETIGFIENASIDIRE